MTNAQPSSESDKTSLGRRELLAYTAAFGSAFLAGQGLLERTAAAKESADRDAAAPKRRYDMKKSINMWAFPYPQKLSLEECFQLAKDAGFDGIEVNFTLEGEFSAESSPAEIEASGQLADRVGIAISGVCSFLYWPYSLTHADPARREKGLELARKMIHAARDLGTKNLLVVPGAVYIPWAPEDVPVPNDVCLRRATEAINAVLPEAKKAGISMNMENIFANGFLLSPEEMNAFVDGFNSPHVNVHFDTGNIMQFQFPEHWFQQSLSVSKGGGRRPHVQRDQCQQALHPMRQGPIR